jgi:DNA-binding transcriptional LysR family regulator
VPPHAAAHAGHLCKRLKDRFPDLKVVVALWMSESSDKLEARLRDAGVDLVVTRLPEAIAKLRELQQYKPLAANQKNQANPQNQGQTTISRRGGG